ncbi:MAG: hypothetical protein FWD61_19895 [Phycisphaerales bacterium]|nr:hypothetical protein [Phycisphaerales bacterium]
MEWRNALRYVGVAVMVLGGIMGGRAASLGRAESLETRLNALLREGGGKEGTELLKGATVGVSVVEVREGNGGGGGF